MKRVTALGMLLARPLAVTSHYLRVMLAVASRDEFFVSDRVQALEAREGTPLRNARMSTKRDGVAIIPVLGPLIRKADMFDEMSNVTSYEAIRRDLQAALDDNDVHSIVFSFNSPGGEVTSCGELADAIYQARDKKRMIAYVDGLACSAAYWLASACERIVTAPSGELGSIGCMLAWLDDRAALESMGVREIKFVSSQSPKKNPDPSSDVGKEEYQRLVDDLAAVFVAGVAKHRGTDEESVIKNYGNGGVLVGAHAVEAGLADELGNFEALLEQLATQEKAKMNTSRYATAIGLKAEATEDEAITRAADLSKFESAVLSAVGATDASDALGRIKANEKTAAKYAEVQKQLEEEQRVGRRSALRAVLEKGLAEGRLDLGLIQKEVPGLLDDEGKTMRAAIDAALVGENDAPIAPTQKTVLDAVCSVDISATELRQVTGYARSLPPRVAATHDEPAAPVTGPTVREVNAKQAGQYGLSEDAVKKYAHVRNVNDLNPKKE